MKRRNLIIGMAVLGCLAAYPGLAGAQSVSEAMPAPGPLPEMGFGQTNAPVTVIEYASLTCPHCRTFHMNVWPEFRKRYVETGQVRFIVREFPLDPRALAGSMLARCAGDDKWEPTVDLLYRTQENWARAANGMTAMKAVMGMTGMAPAEFESCLQDQTLLEQVNAVAEAGRSFGVESTPTFIINGEIYKGALSMERFAGIVDLLIDGTKQQ